MHCFNIEFLPPVSNDKISFYLNNSDVYISTSLSDGTSVSMLEAMACQLPIIVTDLPSSREWVKPNFNGFLPGKKNVVEIGCADAFGTRIVQQEVKDISVLDFDPIFIKDVQSRKDESWPLKEMVHDILDGPIPGAPYEASYSLDVLEHISKKDEDAFLKNIVLSLNDKGILIIGTPSITSQDYASKQSKAGHVNCKSSDELKILLEKYFQNVFIFSMNDEVVHTGFYPMAHYYFALCCGVKSE